MKVVGLISLFIGALLLLAGLWNVQLGHLFVGRVTEKAPLK